MPKDLNVDEEIKEIEVLIYPLSKSKNQEQLAGGLDFANLIKAARDAARGIDIATIALLPIASPVAVGAVGIGVAVDVTAGLAAEAFNGAKEALVGQFLFHAFVVFETDGWFYSVEKNSEGVNLQVIFFFTFFVPL
jgi:hypothetical protein